jgi:multisubunit Na+/H+ antiporter MnhF subunit
MDTSDPIVTIKITTDNSQSIETLIQLVIATLIMLNIKLIFSMVTDLTTIVYYKFSSNNSFYTREDNQHRYTSLE